MTGHRGSETDFENTAIERLLALGYEYEFGMDIARDHREVVLRDRLHANLAKRYAHLPSAALDAAVAVISRPEGADTLRRNQRFHTGILRAGFDLPYERTDGGKAVEHIHPVDWDDPNANDLRVVNQFPIAGKNDRRPDIIIFINGLPLVVFELKNPWSEKPTVDEALNQIAHYRQDISQLFDFNGLVVISDGLETLHGMWTATKEWYAPWKSIDGNAIEPATIASMKMLVEGLFQKARLLEYLRDFIVCETANDVITKKGAKYHQFFAVKEAVARSLSAHRRVIAAASADRRIGVIWHTTGSGKSLSIAFLVGILRRQSELQNPSIVIQVDRTDLDDQLHDQFVAARHLVGEVKHAISFEDLRNLL